MKSLPCYGELGRESGFFVYSDWFPVTGKKNFLIATIFYIKFIIML